MNIDCHTHICAFTKKNGKMSAKLRRRQSFRYMREQISIKRSDERAEQALITNLTTSLAETPELDGVVVLAFDAVYNEIGRLDSAQTHLYVKNDFVAETCRRHPTLFYGASVHPFRTDAIHELERCVAAGAVLMKWLPIVQGFNPSSPKCIPFLEALAHYKLPLLSHTGGERLLIRVNDAWADPRLLEPALKLGVTVIAAHCGTRSASNERDWFNEFAVMLREYENLFGDTSALSQPARVHALEKIAADPFIRGRVIHGSDWPVPPITRLGRGVSPSKSNALLDDVLFKKKMGFDSEYFSRAASVLNIRRRSTGCGPALGNNGKHRIS